MATFQPIDHTGEIVGATGGAATYSTHLRGWAFSNSAGSAATVTFYSPPGATPATIPSASGPNVVVFTIQLAANSSKEFMDHDGVYFPNGLFAVTSATTTTGGVII